MKYRIIGWTDYDNSRVHFKEQTIAKRNVVIDEIRKNGYTFTGEEFQECDGCVPVFNDGTKLYCSRRGWGGIMAEAHGYNGNPYDYALFTDLYPGDENIRPTDGYDSEQFKKPEDLVESITIEVENAELFSDFERGKPVKFFVGKDDKIISALRYLDSGDTLCLIFGDRKVGRVVNTVDFDKECTEEDEIDFYANYTLNIDNESGRRAALERWNAIPTALTVTFIKKAHKE